MCIFNICSFWEVGVWRRLGPYERDFSKLKKYKFNIIIIGKNWSQEDASNKLEEELLRDYKTAFCSPLTHTEINFIATTLTELKRF
jgi:hypothetical protein